MSLITPDHVTSRLGANSWPNRLSAPSSHYCPGLRKPKNEDPIIRPYGSQRTANTSYAHFLCKKLTVQQYTYKSFTNFKYNYHRCLLRHAWVRAVELFYRPPLRRPPHPQGSIIILCQLFFM